MTSAAQADLQTALAPGSLICLDTNCLLYYFKGEMPWADSLRPVFEAKDGGDVRLFTSSMTLAELLARVDPSDQSAMLSAVRQYFDLVPVDDNIGIQAAGIRRSSNVNNAESPPVKTPDAVEMATAGESRSLLFITNDEQLTRMPQTVKSLYLKELALDWLEDEFDSCYLPGVTASIPNSAPQHLDLTFLRDPNQDWMVLQDGLVAETFVTNAMLLSALIKGPCAVIGQAQRQDGEDIVVALRLLPTSRPWLNPTPPEWTKHLPQKKCKWTEPGPGNFIQRVKQSIENSFPFVVINTSRIDAETEVNVPSNRDMADHNKRQDIWRRYLAPFKPVMPLLELDGARLWKAEAQNAHELDVERFRKFYACAENVIGKEDGR